MTLSALEAKYLFDPVPAGSTPNSAASGAEINRDNSVVEYKIGGLDFFPDVISSIRSCSGPGDAIYLLSWIMDDDFRTAPGGPERLRTLLAEKAHAGVDVRVILWANADLLDIRGLAAILPGGAGDFVSTVDLNCAAAESLRAETVPGSASPPLANRVLIDYSGRLTGSHHTKALFVKSTTETTGYLSGMDPFPSRWYVSWHDAGVRLTGAAAIRVLETFRMRWTEASTLPAKTYVNGSGATLTFNPSPTATPIASIPALAMSHTQKSIQIARTLPDCKIYRFFRSNEVWGDPLIRQGLREIEHTLVKAIRAATRFIYVEDQSFSEPATTLFPEIVAAANRGVKVVFLTGGAWDSPGTPPTYPDQLKTEIVDRLSTPSNFKFVHLTGKVVHSKLTIIDDEFCLIGSANFMDRSMNGDDSETSAAIVDDGPDLRGFRIRLWATHLAVSHLDPTVATELGDLAKALSIFVPGWGGAVTFAHPGSLLNPVSIP